jgi:hypothetical protein
MRVIFLFLFGHEMRKPRARAPLSHRELARRVKCKIRSRNTRAAFFRARYDVASLRGLFLHEKLIGAVLIVHPIRTYTRPLHNSPLSRALKRRARGRMRSLLPKLRQRRRVNMLFDRARIKYSFFIKNNHGRQRISRMRERTKPD